jgi:hypothetical protein
MVTAVAALGSLEDDVGSTAMDALLLGRSIAEQDAVGENEYRHSSLPLVLVGCKADVATCSSAAESEQGKRDSWR